MAKSSGRKRGERNWSAAQKEQQAKRVSDGAALQRAAKANPKEGDGVESMSLADLAAEVETLLKRVGTKNAANVPINFSPTCYDHPCIGLRTRSVRGEKGYEEEHEVWIT